MLSIITTVHIIACVILITVVLLQSGKEGMGVIFGGGSQSMFGSSGAGGLLVKITAFLGAVFLITSLGFNYMAGAERRASKSIIPDVVIEENAAVEKNEKKDLPTAEASTKDTAPTDDKAVTNESAVSAAPEVDVKTEANSSETTSAPEAAAPETETAKP
ncbi:preprotein translocase subunit SecG [Desulfovibrio inopinatus]|uniref:preprotein translocase subunit SecG n=1 Tax=Desulfovibrio inopinatus TaxID=102109 RepID=UPI00041289AE